MELTSDREILQSIVKKAWKEPVFKNNLIKNPISTIENFLGRPINLPSGKNLAFVDQTNSSTIFVNIPAEPNMEDMELDEEQLDIVSGGVDGDPPPTVQGIVVNNNGNLFGGG